MKNAYMQIHLTIVMEKLSLETSLKQMKEDVTEKLRLVLEKQSGKFLVMELVVQLIIQIIQENLNVSNCQEKIVPTAPTSQMIITEK